MTLRYALMESSPLRILVISFVVTIVIGTGLLLLPGMAYPSLTLVDSLFTATSAVCVTGLSVVDTTLFTFKGQLVILLLIQTGGLGIMTFSLGIMALLGEEYSIRWRYTLSSMYNGVRGFSVSTILPRILLYTFLIEAVTALFLFLAFSGSYTAPEAAWHALFHGVSAFCNAGFSTLPGSLTMYADNLVVNVTVSSSVILGGLGFLVLHELRHPASFMPRHYWANLSLHTRLTLITTAILLIGGTLMLLFFLPGNLSPLQAFFQSMTCRTAGFNTVDIGNLSRSSAFLMILLMFTGGSPGSIAGGIKTTTLAVIAAIIISRFKGRSQTVLFRRAIDEETMNRAIILLIFSLTLVATAYLILLALEENHSIESLDLLFETVSAFATVGLSRGVTTELNSSSRLILTALMLVGRVGPLTLITALAQRSTPSTMRYVEDRLMIG